MSTITWNVGLIHYQSPNLSDAIVLSPLIQGTIRSPIDKWHLGQGCSGPRSLRPVTNRNYVLSLGMPSIQKRRTRGTQATKVRRLPQSGAAPIAMGMLIAPVRLVSCPSTVNPSDQYILYIA